MDVTESINTGKSRRRRAKARAKGAVRINAELRGEVAKRFKALTKLHGGPTGALNYLVTLSIGRKDMTLDEALAVIRTQTAGQTKQ